MPCSRPIGRLSRFRLILGSSQSASVHWTYFHSSVWLVWTVVCWRPRPSAAVPHYQKEPTTTSPFQLGGNVLLDTGLLRSTLLCEVFNWNQLNVNEHLLLGQESDLHASSLSVNKHLDTHCAYQIRPLQTFPPALAGDQCLSLSLFLSLLFIFWRPQRKNILPRGPILRGRTAVRPLVADMTWGLLYLMGPPLELSTCAYKTNAVSRRQRGGGSRTKAT